MPRRSKVENAPWQAGREYRWTCPICNREISCRGDSQCASRILVHLSTHDALLPLLARCIAEIERRAKEFYQGELKL